MQTIIKFDGLEHTGVFSQDYVDGFVFVYEGTKPEDFDEDQIDELGLTVTGECVLRLHTRNFLGYWCWGTGGESVANSNITNYEQLKEYVNEFDEDGVDPDRIKRYISAVCFGQQEIGGFGRDRSFGYLFTFDDLEFMRGVRACASFFDHVVVDSVLDTHTFKIL